MADYIDRQAAIDALSLMQGIVAHEGVRKGISIAWQQIKDLPSAQPEQRWIPVKWREPDEEEAKYWCYMADCEMPEDGQKILVTDGKYVWKDVHVDDDGLHLDSMEDWQNITAWMPLPEPYKEGEE